MSRNRGGRVSAATSSGNKKIPQALHRNGNRHARRTKELVAIRRNPRTCAYADRRNSTLTVSNLTHRLHRSSTGTTVRVRAPPAPVFHLSQTPCFGNRTPSFRNPKPPFCVLSANFPTQKFGGRETLHTFAAMNESAYIVQGAGIRQARGGFHRSPGRTAVGFAVWTAAFEGVERKRNKRWPTASMVGAGSI
jgi:hypothetical protein